MTDAFDAGMRRWWHENSESREQHVPPDADVYGIDLAVVRPLFAQYTVRLAQWTGAPEESEEHRP